MNLDKGKVAKLLEIAGAKSLGIKKIISVSGLQVLVPGFHLQEGRVKAEVP